MRWLLAIDGVGAVSAAAYAGYVGPAQHTPLWALIALAVFLLGLAVPFYLEYRSVGAGFKNIEASYLERTRRSHFPGPKVEVFTNQQPAPVFHKRRSSMPVVVVLTVLGVALLAVDVVQYLATLPPADVDTGKITNF